ncbi:unnamed protein product, partial [Rotaria magnacalcarata]
YRGVIYETPCNNQAAFNNLVLPGFDEYFDDSIDDQSELETSDDDTDNDECNKNQFIPFAVLNSILTDLNKNCLSLNTKDRKTLEDFVSSFELFNEATILTQGESYATISLVALTILSILIDLEHERAASNLSLVSLCEALISSIKARSSGLLRHFEIDVRFASYSMSERFSDPIFLVTPVLDARFKFLWLDNLQDTLKLRVIEKIHTAFVRFF